MGDALLFSFTSKKPLAIGVARAVFVSSLGATLAMAITFAVWLTLESIYPHLHIDQFFYQLIESRIRTKSFYRIVLIYVLIEVMLMSCTALVGGFLASITPFVGEQNQNKTKFTFSSLLMDLPLGLGTISFVQALTWCMLRYLDRFRPVSKQALQEQQERMIMMMNNQAGNSLKQSRRVTFKTTLDTAMVSNRCSDVSRTSSTAPILEHSTQDQEDSQSITRMASSSSSSTLLPAENTQHTLDSEKKLKVDNVGSPDPHNFDESCAPETPSPPPILNSPAAVRTKTNRRPFGSHHKPAPFASVTPSSSHLPKPSPVAVNGISSHGRLTSGPLGRYAWLKNPTSARGGKFPPSKEGSRGSALACSRSGGIGKGCKPFGGSPYQRVSFQGDRNAGEDDHSSLGSGEFRSLENASNEESLEIHKIRGPYTKRKAVPIESIVDMRSPHLHQNSILENDHTQPEHPGSENDADEWAETKSQLTEDSHEKDRHFGW